MGLIMCEYIMGIEKNGTLYVESTPPLVTISVLGCY